MSLIPADSLESIRNRLNQVHLSLRKLSDQINHHNRHPHVKLPSYTHIQNQFQVLITQLLSIANHLERNDNVLRNTNVYPLPAFPTTQHEGLVTTLLRKKPLPEVDEWIERAIADTEELKVHAAKDDEFAQWCSGKVLELREEFQFYGFLTNDEIDHINSDEGKREADAKKAADDERLRVAHEILGGLPGLSPNVVLKFMSQGVLE